MGPSEQDLTRAVSLGFEAVDEEMTFSSAPGRWEPTHAATPAYRGAHPEPERPGWLPRDIITAATAEELGAVHHVQRVLRCRQTGVIDTETRSAIMGAQRLFGLPVTGVLDAATGRAVDRLADHRGA